MNPGEPASPTTTTGASGKGASATVPNIGLRGQRDRARKGLIMAIVGGVGLTLFLAGSELREMRLAYFPTFWVVGLCVFQAWEKT